MDAALQTQLSIFQTVLHNIECAHMPPPSDEAGAHLWVPFPCGKFVEAILEAFQHRPQEDPKANTFLDIGCGIGTKVMLADVIFEAHGFDVVEKYVDFSRTLGCKRTFVQDAMSYQGYSDFDILYYYAPFRDEVLQKRFENYLRKQMRPGQLLIPRHPMTMWERLPDFKKLGEYVYLHTGEGR